MEETMKTFKEWNVEGFRIHKGAKAQGRNDAGEALFPASATYRQGDWLKTSARLGLPEPGPWSDMPH